MAKNLHLRAAVDEFLAKSPAPRPMSAALRALYADIAAEEAR
jgi:hypothetical protein